MKQRPTCLMCGERIRRSYRAWKWLETDFEREAFIATLKTDAAPRVSKYGGVRYRVGWGFLGYNTLCDKECAFAYLGRLTPKWEECKR